MDTQLAANFFIAMVAIVNPIGKIPVWAEASAGSDRAVRWRLALMVTGTAAAILVLALLAGREALALFAIDLPSFRVAGGIIILLTALEMLRGVAVRVDSEAEDEDAHAYERAKARFRDVVIPVAMPILAGPGSITTVIVYGSRVTAWAEYGLLLAVLGAVMVLVLGVLLASERIRDLVGDMALDVQTRLFGLILAAIAMQLVLEGLGDVYPQWLDPRSPLADDVRGAGPGPEGPAGGTAIDD